MHDSKPDTRNQQIDRILSLLKQFPPDYVESLIEQWMWELDDLWHMKGIPENIAQQIDELGRQNGNTRSNVENRDKDQ